MPAVQEATGASKGALGLAFLFVAVGSLPAMLVTGRELDRHGPRLLPAFLCAFALAVLLPGFAGSPGGLAAALNRGHERVERRPAGSRGFRLSRAAVPLGIACAAAFVIEGGMENWGAIFLERDLDAGPTVSALAPP